MKYSFIINSSCFLHVFSALGIETKIPQALVLRFIAEEKATIEAFEQLKNLAQRLRNCREKPARTPYIMKLPFFIVSFFICVFVYSQEFSANLIPDGLTDKANSVVRVDEMEIVLKGIKKMEVTHRRVVTVLNKPGRKDVDAFLHYRSDNKIKKISATIYDASGKKIKSYKKKDFSDMSAVSGSTLYSDSRVMVLDYSPSSYPYTVEFEYEYTLKSTGFVRNWYPQTNTYQSIEKATYRVVDEANLGLKYKLFNFEEYPTVQFTDNGSGLFFEATNMPSYRYEVYQPSIEEFLPFAYLGIESFSLHGHDASVKDWSDFGSWMYNELISGRDQVSEKTAQEVLALVDGVDDDIEKAKIVYKYVQDNMRYIDVAVGIGGWQPMEASYVDKMKYGDCKGLTNYTHALLKLVDVKSYWTVLWSDSKQKDLYEDFASIQGNHMILNIPVEGGEDVWLECTSSYLPFGFVLPSNSDRNVLVIKENGGELVRTSKLSDDINFQENSSLISLDSSGNMAATIVKKSMGSQFSTRYSLSILPTDEVKKNYLNEFSELPRIKINDFQFTRDDEIPAFYENISLGSEGYAKKMGGRYMFSINPINSSVGQPRKYTDRKNPFVIYRGFTDEDTMTFILPENYIVEALPNPTEIDNKFGFYSINFEVSDGKLEVTRKFQLKSGRFSKDDYEDYRLFMAEVAKIDAGKAVISLAKT